MFTMMSGFVIAINKCTQEPESLTPPAPFVFAALPRIAGYLHLPHTIKKQGERTLVPPGGLEKGHEHHPQDPRTLGLPQGPCTPRLQALSLSASPAPRRRATPSTTSTPWAAAAQAAARETDRSRGAGSPVPARGTAHRLLRPPAGLHRPPGGGTSTRTWAPPGPPRSSCRPSNSNPLRSEQRGPGGTASSWSPG
ncbi:uncharacterized protein LOC133042226 [Dama dama]|uniref:uncharacterized protein LOC133042226 n=1 Tax=Dama dama TaxID=30532 RepID=UPI002A371F10|nr:uncharacterized protein LOC133042226 [Dama dama]